MPSEQIKEIAKPEELKALLDANKFVVVDFHASWCPPCKAIAPLYEKLATDHAASGSLAFAKVNVDDVPEVAQEYSVSAMPTFMFFAAGKPAAVDAKVAITPAVQMGPNGVDMIKGADPRSLVAVVKRLAELGKASSPAAKDGAADKVEAATAGASAAAEAATSVRRESNARKAEEKRLKGDEKRLREEQKARLREQKKAEEMLRKDQKELGRIDEEVQKLEEKRARLEEKRKSLSYPPRSSALA